MVWFKGKVKKDTTGGKDPGKVRIAGSWTSGSLEQRFWVRRKQPVMRQELFGAGMQVSAQAGKVGGVSWPRWRLPLPGEGKVTCRHRTPTSWRTHKAPQVAESCPLRCEVTLADSLPSSTQRAAVPGLLLRFSALSDLADPRQGWLPIPPFLTCPIWLSKPSLLDERRERNLWAKR